MLIFIWGRGVGLEVMVFYVTFNNISVIQCTSRITSSYFMPINLVQYNQHYN